MLSFILFQCAWIVECIVAQIFGRFKRRHLRIQTDLIRQTKYDRMSMQSIVVYIKQINHQSLFDLEWIARFDMFALCSILILKPKRNLIGSPLLLLLFQSNIYLLTIKSIYGTNTGVTHKEYQTVFLHVHIQSGVRTQLASNWVNAIWFFPLLTYSQTSHVMYALFLSLVIHEKKIFLFFSLMRLNLWKQRWLIYTSTHQQAEISIYDQFVLSLVRSLSIKSLRLFLVFCFCFEFTYGRFGLVLCVQRLCAISP